MKNFQPKKGRVLIEAQNFNIFLPLAPLEIQKFVLATINFNLGGELTPLWASFVNRMSWVTKELMLGLLKLISKLIFAIPWNRLLKTLSRSTMSNQLSFVSAFPILGENVLPSSGGNRG